MKNKIIDQIDLRKSLARGQGGPEGIAKQHEAGRLTVRERIELLLEKDSFKEQGQGSGSAVLNANGTLKDFIPSNYVLGFGTINGRQVVVGGEDFTLKGGSPNASGLRKSVYSEHLAFDYRIPLVRLLEGGGGSVSGGKSGGTVGVPVYNEHRFRIIAQALATVPVVSAGLGPVAGFPAGRLVASHFSVMVKGVSQIMTGGPRIVERAVGKKMTKEELGGHEVHNTSGVVDNIVDSEKEALSQVTRFLDYLPPSCYELAKRADCSDPANREEPFLDSVIPSDSNAWFDVRKVIGAIFDKESIFEIGCGYGPGLVTGLGRLNGYPAAFIANDSAHYAGSMTAAAAQRTRRMIEMCDLFNIPIVNFIDEPGFMIGLQAEKEGTIRYGMAAVSAAAMSIVPWASIQLRKCFGVAGAAHFASKGTVFLWPSAESGALPVEGGVAVAFQKEIAQAPDPVAKRKEIEDKLRSARSPIPRMESFSAHDLIAPRQTRQALCEWIELSQAKLKACCGPTSFGFRP